MNDPYETTETHLERLMGRALNSFDLPDTTVERLELALAHASSLHSSHHSAALHRTTFRHTYLLSDGTTLTLWELAHNAGRDSGEQYELYTDEAEAILAASRLPLTDGRGGGALGAVPSTDARAEGALVEDALAKDSPAWHALAEDMELVARLLARPLPAGPRRYVPDNSADHARRVLRRAENPDRPGEETASRLRSAFAHHITQAFGRHCATEGASGSAGFTLYEHAFLLLDGSELSLWEVEHTATPDGRHMCEVYGEERVAREAMEHRARVR